MTIYNYNRETFLEDIKKFFNSVDVLLDVGSGIRPFVDIKNKVHICIEPYKKYIDIIQGFCPTDSQYIFLNTDAVSGLKTFADNSVDSVCIIDLIEHLEKNDGFELLKEADRVARNQIIVMTPLGFFPQDYEEGEKDGWGLDGASFQVHKSGWLPEDFGKDWDFHICEKFHLKEEIHIPIERDYGCFFAIKNKVFSGYEPQKDVPEFVKYNASSNRLLRERGSNV